MKKIIDLLRSAVLAGVCIGIAGFGYLATRDIIGSVLFAFGLLTVVGYKLKLYTGTAGFITKGEVGSLFMILLLPSAARHKPSGHIPTQQHRHM